MQTAEPQRLTIPHTRPIPALLWGEGDGPLVLAVHGYMSHKADDVSCVLAGVATETGGRVLSFDLPEHGDRRGENYACTHAHAVADLLAVYAQAASCATDIRFFGCSIGVYYGLLAFADVPFTQSWFLSPVLNLERLTSRWMAEAGISEQQLQQAGRLPLPAGPVLDWDDYCYIRRHSIAGWRSPTRILYGAHDDMTDRDTLDTFAQTHAAAVRIQENGEHWFHTPEQLRLLRDWLRESWN